jgi:hypothetical protein
MQRPWASADSGLAAAAIPSACSNRRRDIVRAAMIDLSRNVCEFLKRV